MDDNDKQLSIYDKPVTVSAEQPAYIKAAISDNTRLAYQSDIEHFLNSGRELPTTPASIETYLKEGAKQYNPRTLTRRMTAIRQWHQLKGYPDPTNDPIVKKTLRGITRLHGKPKKQAPALSLKELDKLSEHLKSEPSLINIRNRALILVGFFGAFRRSELVAITWENIRFVSDGMTIMVSRSKTDQAGEGMRCAIPFGNDVRCPVRALLEWQQASRLTSGPVFRRISKVETINDKAITPRYLNQIIRGVAEGAGLPHYEQLSSHSLRRGFATEASRLGAAMPAIQRHGRWRSTKTVVEYIEAGRQFADSAVNVLFDF